eukprot:Rhum_TRINITY_DN23632_c0_g1::Rhum_TRINITY_DN23632_c0_g1_i1::g.178475::m.178475
MRTVFLLAAAATAAGTIYEANTEYTVFPSLSCDNFAFTSACTCDTTIKSSVVRVMEGHVDGESTLSCGACAGLGVTATFDTASGVLIIAGEATLRKHAEAVASVKFTTTSTVADYRVQYNFGHGIFAQETGHFYNFHHYQMPCP